MLATVAISAAAVYTLNAVPVSMAARVRFIRSLNEPDPASLQMLVQTRA